jgi:hypothetical protein
MEKRLKALRSKTLQGQQVQWLIESHKEKIKEKKKGKTWEDQK